jgi:hypothetical protein
VLAYAPCKSRADLQKHASDTQCCRSANVSNGDIAYHVAGPGINQQGHAAIVTVSLSAGKANPVANRLLDPPRDSPANKGNARAPVAPSMREAF